MTRLRTFSAAAGAVLVLEAAALAVVLIVTLGGGRGVLLPVDGEFAGGVRPPSTGSTGSTWVPGSTGSTRVMLAQIDLGVAVIVLCLIVAAARLFVLIPAFDNSRVRDLAHGRHTARWVEFSLMSSITVFLIAQLNGIVDLVALVLAYAATSGMSLLGLLQERIVVRSGHPLLPLCFGAAIGIVPWGAIAFTQIGSGVTGQPVPLIVRVVTLVMLAFAFAFAIIQWREQSHRVGIERDARAPIDGLERPRATHSDERGEWMHVALSFASVSVFAWLVVLGVVPLLAGT